jgi:hypothetical protein
MLNANYLENNKKLPYTKEELEKVKQGFEAIYTKHLTAWQTKALANRQSMSPAEYESANLLALEEVRTLIVKDLYATYGKTIIEKVFKQFYATGTQKKK